MFDLDRLEEFDRCLQELAPAKPATRSHTKPAPAQQQCPYQKELQTA
jgi:hypothetical protein